MPVIRNLQSCHLRVFLLYWLAALLVLPGVSKAGAQPVVSVQTARNATASGSQSGAFTVQRTGDTGQALVVNYRISGTATNGMDYQRLSGAVTLPAGQSSATIGVLPTGNPVEGSNKNVAVTLAPQNQPFTLVALPDTQYYTHEIYGGSRDMFTAQTQWIANHKDDSNIVFVLHEGDLTDDNNAPEWTNARTSMSVLDGVVPYAITVGNHDGLGTSQNQTALFNQFFPLSQYQNLPTFGGVFESNRMDNCYHLFNVGGVDWLLISLEFGPRDSVLAWANQVVTNYPNRRVIVLTHAYLYPDNTLLGSSTNQGAVPTAYSRMNDGTDIWEKFVRHHANISFVLCGHVGDAGRLVSAGDYGNQVFQLLADYQFDALGGGAYLRIIQFFPDQDQMSVKTYSPFLDRWLTDTNNQFAYTNLGVFTNAGPGYLVDTQSASAGLIITNDIVDLTPPGVRGLSYAGVPPIIKVTFNEPVETVSAQTVINYSMDNAVHLTGATLLSDGKTVALATDSDFTPGTLYTLTVNHVKDCARAANVMVLPATNTFLYSPILLADDFTNGVLQGWTVVDEGTIEAPSEWLEQSGRMMQLSNIYGPGGNATDHRKGTYLYWNDPQALSWSTYTLSVTFKDTDDDGVGVMFRYQNPSNYYKVDLDSQRNFHKLFKMSGGVETTLAAEPGAYTMGGTYVLSVGVTNGTTTVLLNGTVLFGGAVTDSNNNLRAGTVALYSWGSQGVFFNHLTVTPPFSRSLPSITIQTPTNGAMITQPNPVPVAVDAFAPNGSIKEVDLFWGTNILATLTNAPYLFQWTNLPPGNCTLTAQAVDNAGSIGVSTPVNFVVTSPRRLPSITIQTPTNGAVITQPNPVPVAVDASDPDGSLKEVDLFWGTNILATLTNAPYLFQWTNLPPGNCTLTAQVVDNAGPIGVSTPVSFTVTPPPLPPVFLGQPANQNVHLGNVAMFHVRTGGSQPVYYQWLFNGAPMDGATHSFLILTNVQSANAGSYTVMITNQWGSAVSQPAMLSVNSAIQPNINANTPPSLLLPSLEMLDLGVPLVSVNVTNINVVNIEWSSNCLTWTKLLTLTNNGGVLYFADPDAVNCPQRFYRAMAQL
jgi:hypothetical protein